MGLTRAGVVVEFGFLVAKIPNCQCQEDETGGLYNL